jgi:hypothetical protein
MIKRKRKQCCYCKRTFYKPTSWLFVYWGDFEIKKVCPYCDCEQWIIV